MPPAELSPMELAAEKPIGGIHPLHDRIEHVEYNPAPFIGNRLA